MFTDNDASLSKAGAKIVGAPVNGALAEIAASIRVLHQPPPALYYVCNQERVREHLAQIAALDSQLEDVRKRAFAAAVRLMSLRKPARGPQADSAAEQGGTS